MPGDYDVSDSGDFAEQQEEAQCEDDGAGPSNRPNQHGQEAKRVKVDKFNPIQSYGKTVNKTGGDLINERQTELDATIQKFTFGNCTRGFHSIHSIPKHPDLKVTFSFCKAESNTDQNREEKVFEAKIRKKWVKESE